MATRYEKESGECDRESEAEWAYECEGECGGEGEGKCYGESKRQRGG